LTQKKPERKNGSEGKGGRAGRSVIEEDERGKGRNSKTKPMLQENGERRSPGLTIKHTIRWSRTQATAYSYKAKFFAGFGVKKRTKAIYRIFHVLVKTRK
jgi:hypothetical protein